MACVNVDLPLLSRPMTSTVISLGRLGPPLMQLPIVLAVSYVLMTAGDGKKQRHVRREWSRRCENFDDNECVPSGRRSKWLFKYKQQQATAPSRPELHA